MKIATILLFLLCISTRADQFSDVRASWLNHLNEINSVVAELQVLSAKQSTTTTERERMLFLGERLRLLQIKAAEEYERMKRIAFEVYSSNKAGYYMMVSSHFDISGD